MKQKNGIVLKRLTAMLLAVILLCSSTNVIQVLAGINPGQQYDAITKGDKANGGSSAGNGTGASYDFGIKSFADTSQCISSRAYLITIQKLENHALLSDKLSPEYTSAKASIGEDLTQVAFSSAYEHLTKYPACFSSATLLSSGLTSYALVGVKDNNGITGVMQTRTLRQKFASKFPPPRTRCKKDCWGY